MLNLTCAAAVDKGAGRATVALADLSCGKDAVLLDVHVATGEMDAYCADHRDFTGGQGYLVIHTEGPLHSVSLFTR